MSPIRRLCLVVLTLGIAGTLAFQMDAPAQQKGGIAIKMAEPAVGGPEVSAAISFPTDRQSKKRIEAAQDYMKDQAWGEATRLLQSLLDAKEDLFMQLERKTKALDGKEINDTHWVSMKTEANRLIGAMPPEGLQFYQIQYGAAAKGRLDEAKEKSDAHILAEVAQRFLHTDAGAEAINLLGTYHLDRGSSLPAALCFERLLTRAGSDKLAATTLYKAALAFHRTGDKTNYEKAWTRLLARADRDTLVLGSRKIPIDQLEKYIHNGTAQKLLASLHDWPLFRGNPSRNAQGIGSAPFLDARWSVSTLPPIDRVENKASHDWIEQNLKVTQTYLDQRQQVALPASFPIAAGKKLVYRSFDGIYAVNLKDGELEWMSPADHGLHVMIRDAGKKMQLDQWWTGQNYGFGYIINGPHGILIENSVTGCLSTDNAKVYAVDEMAVPPPAQLMQQFQMGGQPQFGEMTDMIYHSRLKAFELDSGKIAWELGGRGEAPKDEKDPDKYSFSDTWFLGAPLCMGGKLYVLTERNAELRLVCIDPPKDANGKPRVSWYQTLASTRDRLPLDSMRRVHAVHLAYGDGILVCPTNAGAVLGVDMLSHSLVWARPYREEVPVAEPTPQPLGGAIRRRPFPGGQPMNMASEWKVSAPAIQNGKVVFTAPDAPSLHCLNLRDGEPIWKMKREPDDLFMAGVFNGKVLIVSKGSVRALALDDGKQLWRVNTGVPSGQGIASNDVYFLPLKEGIETKEPEVCQIDINKGEILAHTRSRKKEVPGNLVFYEGDVISQTGTSLAAYPQLRVKLAQIEERLKGDAKDPLGLTERAELYLDKGDLEGAVADLHAALANNPPPDIMPKTRAKLFDSLTELIQRDFDKGEKYLEEYKDLCRVDVPKDATPEQSRSMKDEEQRRHSNRLCLVAKGKEKQGKLVEAFDAYMDFGGLAGHKELISVIDEPNTRSRPDVWARGRILAMIGKASEPQRKPLEDKIAERWKAVKDTSDPQALRNFVALFGSLFLSGKQARLQLAERLMQDSNEDDLREAQLHLLQLRGQRDDPTYAAQAVEALARLMLRKGLMEHAAHYYRELGRDFAEVAVKDGKTGADFYNDLATDKRFLPFLDDPRQSWNGNIKAKEFSGQFQQQKQLFTFDADGELLPFFQRHRMVLDMNNLQFQIVDRHANKEHWTTQRLVPAYYLQQNQPNARFSYSVKGHLVVVQLSHMVYAFDPVDKKKLWEFNLYGPGLTPQLNNLRNFTQDRDGSLILTYPDGWMQRVGQPGPIESSYVCLQTRDGLVAHDPIRDTVLWSKTGISSRASVFGDSEHIYIVEMDLNNNPTSTRAVRAVDGVFVEVPDFTAAFQRRLRSIGRHLLLQDNEAGGMALRLYDVHTGKDIWMRSFPANSIVLKSDESRVAGVVEPSGRVIVLDLVTQTEVLNGVAERAHAEKLQDAWVLHDADRYYVMMNKPPDPQLAQGGPFPNVMQGMRSIPANGHLYVYDKATSKMLWNAELHQQMLVLDQFEDLPIVLFTSRSNRLAQGRFNGQQTVAVRSYHKKSGKLLLDNPTLGQNAQQFYALNTDIKGGAIELVSYNLKIRHYLDTGDGKDGEGPKSEGAQGSAAGGGAPPLRIEIRKQ